MYDMSEYIYIYMVFTSIVPAQLAQHRMSRTMCSSVESHLPVSEHRCPQHIMKVLLKLATRQCSCDTASNSIVGLIVIICIL